MDATRPYPDWISLIDKLSGFHNEWIQALKSSVFDGMPLCLAFAHGCSPALRFIFAKHDCTKMLDAIAT